MIKKLTFGIVSLGVIALAQNASAQNTLQFVGNGYAIVDISGAGDTFYDINNQGNDSITPSFDTDDSSPTAFTLTFTINQGTSFLLGAQLQTFQQVGGTSAFLGYSVTDLTETTGSFTEMNLPFQMTSGSNDQWQQLASTSGVDIGSSLAPGTYLLAVYEHATNGATSVFNNEGNTANNNWEARIVVNAVPEPSSLTLLLAGPVLLGGWLFLRRRRVS